MEYGLAKSPNYENSECKPKSYYGISKLKSTQALKKSQLNYIVLRLYQIYGPYQKINRLIPIAINQLLDNKKFNASSGRQVRDFLYVDDFVDGVLMCLCQNNFYHYLLLFPLNNLFF